MTKELYIEKLETRILELENFLKKISLAGFIVSSSDCSEIGIACAKNRGDFLVIGELGFVRRLRNERYI